MRTIDDLAELDALPPWSAISDHGRLAFKNSRGTWEYSDGQPWTVSVPVQFVGTASRA